MFVPTEGPPGAKIMLVGEAPGADEDTLGKPFVGSAGKTLNQILSQAGIARHECLITNVARERPPGNKISFYFEDRACLKPKPVLVGWLNLLKKEIELYNPNIIVALGATALWALTGEKKISEFRGYLLPCTLVAGKKVLATYHPQNINYEWKNLFPSVLDLRKALRHSDSPEFPVDRRVLDYDVSVKTFVSYVESLISDPSIKSVAFDIETLQPGSHVDIVGLSHSKNYGISLRLLNGRVSAMPENDEHAVWSALARLFDCKNVIMQNGSYDKGVVWYNNHVMIKNFGFDTHIAAHCCWPELPRSLGFLASICLDVPPWKGSMKENRSLYNAADCANTFGIAEFLFYEMNRLGVRDTFNFEMSLIDVALMMQLQGMRIDEEERQRLIAYHTERKNTLLAELREKVGREVNYNSSKQLQQLLYLELGLPVQYKRRKSVNDPKTITTDGNALRKLAMLVPDNKIFNLIIDYKKSDKLISGFLLTDISPQGKVHTSYNITGSSLDEEGRKSFGRWSSSASIILPFGNGNLQNIPYEARKMYKVPKGYKLVQADFVQAEAVVVAHLINDHSMVKVFTESYGLIGDARKPYDIHRITASMMFNIPFDLVTSDQRKVGKMLRHATNYSAGPGVLANGLGISLKEAKQLIDLYHRRNPLLRIWYQRIQDELRNGRILTNLSGRKHRFLDRWGDSLFRSAYSYKPQSTVGDLLNNALLRIYTEFGREIEICMQLHDAVYVIVPEDRVAYYVNKIYNLMKIPLVHGHEVFYVDVDFKVGDSWADQVDYLREV